MRTFLITLFLMTIIAVALLAADPTAYVLNSNAETVSKIDVTGGTVTNDIFTVGSDISSYPNQMVIRDTLMYIVGSGTSEIQVVNLKTESTIKYIPIGTASNPYWFDFIDDRYMLVTLMLNNSLAVIDLASDAVIGEIPVGKSPEGIIIVGDKALIACTGFDWSLYTYDPGMVYVYDLIDEQVTDSIAVGLNPQYLAMDSLGRVHVSCTGDYFSIFGSSYIIDPSTNSVIDSILLGGSPGQINIGPDNIAYVAAAGWTEQGYIYTYNALTGEVYHDSNNPVSVDLNCLTAVPFQDSSVFEGSFGTNRINRIDSSGSVSESYAVNNGPVHVAFNYIPGDVNGDFNVNILDITDMIDWIYNDGTPAKWPRWRANTNADENYNLLDITFLINFLYLDGARPRVGPHWILR